MDYRWRVILHSDAFDLETVEESFLLSDVSILKKDATLYLLGERFEAFNTYKEVHSSAQEVISTLNLTLRLTNPDFQPVKFGGIVERRADGSSVTHQWLFPLGARARVKVGAVVIKADGQVRPPPRQPTLAERVAKVVESNEHFLAAMRAFDAEPKNYKDLYIAYETIRKGISPYNNHSDLIQLGSVEERILERFYDTAHYYRHGFPRRDMKLPELPRAEAEEVIRRLLVSWAKKLSAGI